MTFPDPRLGLSEPQPDTPIPALRARIRALGVPDYLIWLRFIAYGGFADLTEFEAYLLEALSPDPLTLTVLGQVVWEFEQFGPDE